jgi:hypothetical protein
MRWALPLVALCGGCLDFGHLEKPFCATANAVLCDDFEADGASPAWMELTSGGTLDRVAPTAQTDPDTAFRGKQALRVRVTGAGHATLSDTAATAKLTGDLWVRSFVYFPASPPFDAGSPPGGDLELISLRDAAGNPLLQLRLDESNLHVAAGSRDARSGSPVAAHTWVCVELGLISSNPRAEAYIAEGTTPVALLPQLDVGAVAETRVGMDREGAMMPQQAEIWMDEVILDSQRVGCSR